MSNNDNCEFVVVGFNIYEKYNIEIGEKINILFHPNINEWNGNRSIEGLLLGIEKIA